MNARFELFSEKSNKKDNQTFIFHISKANTCIYVELLCFQDNQSSNCQNIWKPSTPNSNCILRAWHEMVVETETIQLFQLIGFRVNLRDSRSWLKKFIPMSYNAPIFRINDSWPRTRRSLLLKQVQQSSWTIDQKIYSSNFLRSEAFLTYL